MTSGANELQVWVWGLDDEFGYVVARLETNQVLTILRKVSRLATPWLEGVRTDKDLVAALSARSNRDFSTKSALGSEMNSVASRWRFYRSPDTQPPLCFPSLLHWLWYLDSDRREVKTVSRRFCADCSRGHQLKMIQVDRCGHPEVDPEEQRDRALSEDFIPRKKMGRPRKDKQAAAQ